MRMWQVEGWKGEYKRKKKMHLGHYFSSFFLGCRNWERGEERGAALMVLLLPCRGFCYTKRVRSLLFDLTYIIACIDHVFLWLWWGDDEKKKKKKRKIEEEHGIDRKERRKRWAKKLMENKGWKWWKKIKVCV